MQGDELVLTVVPEPGTLAVLATAAIVVLGLVCSRGVNMHRRLVTDQGRRVFRWQFHVAEFSALADSGLWELENACIRGKGWHPMRKNLVALVAAAALLGATRSAPTQSYEWVRTVGSLGSGNGQLNYPWGIAVDAPGNVWVADSGNLA